MISASQGPRRRGGQPRISRDLIIRAAYELGIEHLTMAAVAEKLGTSHQALYNYVRDRDELVELVSDVIVQQLKVPELPGGDWRGTLRGLAHNLRRLLVDVPGFAAAGLGKFRTSQEFLRLNQQVLQHLVEAGFDPAAGLRIYHTFATSLLGWVVREEAYAPLRDDSGEIADALDKTVAETGGNLALARQATFAEFMASADERFNFLVETLLAGFPDPPVRPTPTAPEIR